MCKIPYTLAHARVSACNTHMADKIKINGDDNIIIQGVDNSTVNVTKILAKSYEYNDLLDRLKEKQEFFDLIPEKNTERRIKLSAEINQLTDIIKQFKRDVLALAETFDKIEINTDRLRRAKEFFDKGDIGEARAVLETELEQMQDEQARLLKKDEEYKTDTLPKLINNSEEFYLLAMATQADYANPNRFEDTCKYFETSIKSYAGKDNVFEYAYFLYAHNQLGKAEEFYQKYLNDFASDISTAERATTLNNLAILHRNQNNFDEALKEYEEALQIYRNLAETNPQTYLPYVATTLNNLANLHSDQNNFDEALNEYEEALDIRRNLFERMPDAYAPDLAMTLINLAIFYQESVPEREKSLEYIIEAVMLLLPIVEKVPFTQRYLEVAMCVLKRWDLSDEEIEQLITEKMKEAEENKA